MVPSPALVERFEFHDRRAVIVAHPEGGRCRPIIDKYSSDVRWPRKQVLDELPGPGIEPQNAIGEFTAAPHISIFIARGIVRPGSGRRRGPFLKPLGPRIEHADLIAVIFA